MRAGFCFRRTGGAGVVANQARGQHRRLVARGSAEFLCVLEEEERTIDVAAGRQESRAVQKEESAPRRVARRLAAFEQRFGPKTRVGELAGDRLQRKPCQSSFGPFAAGRQSLLYRRLGGLNVTAGVFLERGLHQQGTRLLLRGFRRADERVNELAEVPQGTPPFEESDESFERFTKLRVGVERGEIVARCSGLVPGALFDLADLAEQAGLPRA